MSEEIPRLRMFAGPNGSGKSTLKTILPPKLLGVYLNPDDIEKEMKEAGGLDLSQYGITFSESGVKRFFRESPFLKEQGLEQIANNLTMEDDRLRFEQTTVNSYLASVVVDFLRRRLIDGRASFTFETVMSHPGKVELFREAQRLGYRTYLYFVATEDPAINVFRVRGRVARGGHDVPEDRIVKRYHASLDLVIEAIRCSNRAYIFDNSLEGEAKTWLAEVTDGRNLEMKVEQMPAWFKRAIWDKIG